MKFFIQFIIFLLIIAIFVVGLLLLKKNNKENIEDFRDLKIEIVSPKEYYIGGKSTLEFYIRNKQNEIIKSFSKNKGNLMDVVLVDKILSVFVHYYPKFNQKTGAFVVDDYYIPKEGMYRLFAEFAPGDSPSQILVADFETGFDSSDSEKAKKEYFLSNNLIPTGYVSEVDGYQITIKNEGKLNLAFEIRENGNLVKNLEEINGGLGDLYIIRSKDLSILRAEFQKTKNQDGVISFKTNFSGDGINKAYLEFRHNNKLHVAEFVFDIKELVK